MSAAGKKMHRADLADLWHLIEVMIGLVPTLRICFMNLHRLHPIFSGTPSRSAVRICARGQGHATIVGIGHCSREA